MTSQMSPLHAALREQKETKMKGETNTIGVTTDETIYVDDIMETMNHFRCIDLIIDKA